MSPPCSDASRCPLCDRSNACAEARGGSPGVPAARCWCMDATIDPLLLARVPPGQRGLSCICADCAAGAPKIGASLNPLPRSTPCPLTTSK
ncbi:MAG: cysteine-rich CWC family protein [Xylophilus ampelinus]